MTESSLHPRGSPWSCTANQAHVPKRPHIRVRIESEGEATDTSLQGGKGSRGHAQPRPPAPSFKKVPRIRVGLILAALRHHVLGKQAKVLSFSGRGLRGEARKGS